ncbi:MAG TPA: hypothetical protein VML96_11270, partial [Egibacteraceae bacterium]|nr:hypothetical protein [Egibacteraceae bacterium]
SLLLLLTALWIAMAYAGGIEAMQDNLAWWTAGSAVVAMFVGGMLAGWLSGVPGAGSGFFNGLAVWALILIASLLIGVPGALQAANLDAITVNGAEVELATQGNALWATFFSLLIGALAAGLGGAIGGAVTRPAFAQAAQHVERDERRVRRDERDRDDERYRDRDDERYRDRPMAARDEHLHDRPVVTDRDTPRPAPSGADYASERAYDDEEDADRTFDRTAREERTIDLREEEAGRRREP